MTSVDDAQRMVLNEASAPTPQAMPLAESLGLVLAEDITSDLDMPPFDKSLMDGFAVRIADVAAGVALRVAGELFAGQTPQRAVDHGEAIRIMTGAPIPSGADAVVMVERTRSDGSNVWIDDPKLAIGQNIMRRATELASGQVVLRAGTVLRPAEIGVLAAVGQARPSVYRRPRVGVLSTGDEIVDAAERPGPGQIRNSNGPMLAALVTRSGATAEYLGIARDTNDDLRRLATRALDADMLLLSGGVSAGELDLVPGVLRSLGVREVFHKVHLKPGKPVWFGVATAHGPRPTAHNPLVFGLPGNPVSVMVCFELFVRPAIRRLLGVPPAVPPLVTATLMEHKSYRSDRPTYWPAWLESVEAGYRVRAVVWQGSPDLRAMTEANALVFFPPGDHQLRAGDRVQVLAL